MTTPSITIRGARQHNLKNLDLSIPLRELTVITGPSGSGKSSLAFHTLYAEGQRRYVETFSPYVRQFLDRMDKPSVDRIDGIPPAIAIEQKNNIRTTRSTVGTLTELNDYLKVIFPRLAKAYDPETGEEIKPDTTTSISSWAYENHAGENTLVLFPIAVPTGSTTAEVCTFLHPQGYLRIWKNGEIIRTDECDDDSPWKAAVVHVIQDRIKLTKANKARLAEALEAALNFGRGHCTLIPSGSQASKLPNNKPQAFSTEWTNPNTGFTLRPPSAALFSFNSPLGACPKCRGFGRVIGIDLNKSVHDPTLSLKDGVVKPFQGERGAECQRDLIRCAKAKGISISTPWHDLTNTEQKWVLQGEKGDHEELWRDGLWYGVKGFFDWMETKAYKMHVRVFLSRYRAYTECPDCNGTRLKPDALCFKIDGKTLPDLWHIPVGELLTWFEDMVGSDSTANFKLPTENSPLDKTTSTALTEILSRLYYLNEVGLSYLTLDRPARTLSGGEIERVNLTTCLGAALTNTLFVLDEPTVGLHARDIHRLVSVMHNLRDKGNTVVVVEHEEAVMHAADNIIDMGPAAGEHGGQIVASVSGKKAHQKTTLKQHPDSLTLPYLSGQKEIQQPEKRRKSKKFLKITGARKHNINGLDVAIPIGTFTCLTGVSGSGKSTLANDIIHRNLLKHFHLPTEEEPAFIKKLTGAQYISGVECVDQSPLTKTPRSTPAVYSGAFDAIRELYALSPEGKTRKLKPGYFSFNSGEGRCERCWGNGFEKVEMQFLSDLYITCPECNAARYNSSALEIQLDGRNIAETLRLTVSEALKLFVPSEEKSKTNTLKTKIQKALLPLEEVGLGYLRLGQPLNTLSGGESQRLKLCQLLSQTKGSENKLLILDEPTTGLHFTDIEKLLTVFQRLVENGHTLLVIEHQLDVIKSADRLIEIGPGAGTHGGQIVFTGTPEDILTTKTETAKAVAESSGGAIHSPATDGLQPPKNNRRKAEKSTAHSTLHTANSIHISGAREHNLKNIDISIPRDELCVVTGLSGSGKSTLAFDIIFAEGQRRFLDSMSPYARQFAGQMEKPDIDKIEGLPPTVAIEQRVSRGGGKSTVGTVTEIYHFLRLLYAKLGIQHCPESGEAVVSQTVDAIHQQLKAHFKKHPKSLLLAPLIKGRKGYHTDVAEAAARQGFTHLLVDGKLTAIADFKPLARYKEHDIDAVICEKSPSLEDLELALKIGKGQCSVASGTSHSSLHTAHFSTERVSPVTGRSFPELDPHHFSFNSPRGWCPECRGYGTVTVTVGKKKKKRSKANEFNSQLEAEIAEEISHGKDDEDTIKHTCSECHGSRLREEARHVFLHDKRIGDLTTMAVTDAADLLEAWKFTGREKLIARDILPEITQRLRFLENVGLNYLTLDRSADTLSGGESQRIRLAAQLGSNLTGVLYVLDEPTIGLHPRDNKQLLDTLEALRSRGNSLLVVEHDDETMRRATQLIDLGPGAGVLGGQVMAATSGKKAQQKNALKLFPDSPTIQAIAQPLNHPLRGKRRSIPKVSEKGAWLKLTGCSHNNLKDIDARIPHGRLTVITGVSGCGKSSFMRGTLAVAAVSNRRNIAEVSNLRRQTGKNLKSSSTLWKSLSGFDKIKHCFEVDQTPIGKTSRSCPATYVKIFDDIRKLFAQIPEARMRGYTASRFSFNNAEGQCPECKGNGRIKLEMDFLPTTWTHCEACRELRYNPGTLEVRYNGKTIGDVLNLSIAEAADFFSAHPKLSRTLSLLTETGLGYLKLGQPSPTLSGGEAQRLKLVAELTKGRKSVRTLKPQSTNLYLIEEPTIGLHQEDVRKLIEVLHRLVDEGHTVVVIEHHTAIMAEADYLIDMGPEAGENGGNIVAQGKPEQVAKSKTSRTAPFLREALNL